MKILFVNTSNLCECFISTSVLKGIYKEYKDKLIIDCVVSDEKSKIIFSHNQKIRSVYKEDDIDYLGENYDLLLCLSPFFTKEIKAKEKRGIGFHKYSNSFYEILYGNKQTEKNIFQVYYNLAGLKWHGEGYNFSYFPSCKSKKNRTGIAVANNNLRHYIIEKLKINESDLWTVPYRNNLFKKIDEINRCNNIITDDYFIMHLSIFLRKYVFFLKTINYTTQFEFFGKGDVIDVPINFVR